MVRSKRELERALEKFDSDDGDGDTLEVTIRRDRVDENGEIVERNRSRVFLG